MGNLLAIKFKDMGARKKVQTQTIDMRVESRVQQKILDSKVWL